MADIRKGGVLNQVPDSIEGRRGFTRALLDLSFSRRKKVNGHDYLYVKHPNEKALEMASRSLQDHDISHKITRYEGKPAILISDDAISLARKRIGTKSRKFSNR